MPGQHTTDDILVDSQTKGLGQVLSDSGAAKARAAAFELADGVDQFRVRPSWPWFVPGTRAEEEPAFGNIGAGHGSGAGWRGEGPPQRGGADAD